MSDQRTNGPPGAAIGGLPIYYEIGGGGKEHGEEVKAPAAQPFARNEEIALPTEAQVKAFTEGARGRRICSGCRYWLNQKAEGARTMYGKILGENHRGLKADLVVDGGWDPRWVGDGPRSGMRPFEYGVCGLDSREAHGTLQGAVLLTHFSATCDNWTDKDAPKNTWIKRLLGGGK